MTKSVSHVRNPLTVISIFAGLAEISGTGILPFIASENQTTYIWFLMLFPAFLVSAFFLTLNFNHKVLYAPSDYKDERNFVNTYGNASPEETNLNLRREVAEIEESQKEERNEEKPLDAPQENFEIEHRVFVEAFDRRRLLMAEVALAEKLAINSLSKELGLNFRREVRILTANAQSAYFDAVAMTDNEIHAVEVKLLKSKRLNLGSFLDVFRQAEFAKQSLAAEESRGFILHTFVVLDNPALDKELVRLSLHEEASRFNVHVQVHVVTLSDLQNEYQYSP